MHKDTLTESKAKEGLDSIKEFIKSLDGKVEKEDVWGKRKLAYKLDKSFDAYYSLLDIDMGSESSKKLLQRLRINTDLLRYLLIKKEI